MKKLVICSAFFKEIRPLFRSLRPRPLPAFNTRCRAYLHEGHGRQVHIIVLGMGRKNAFHNLDRSIKEYGLDREALWVLTGYAGGVDPALKAGEIIVPDVITDGKENWQVSGKGLR
jgi:nucleoside phosphorylase